jgi:hypothetical protein
MPRQMQVALELSVFSQTVLFLVTFYYTLWKVSWPFCEINGKCKDGDGGHGRVGSRRRYSYVSFMFSLAPNPRFPGVSLSCFSYSIYCHHFFFNIFLSYSQPSICLLRLSAQLRSLIAQPLSPYAISTCCQTIFHHVDHLLAIKPIGRDRENPFKELLMVRESHSNAT